MKFNVLMHFEYKLADDNVIVVRCKKMLLISSLYLSVFSGYHFSDFSSNRKQSIYNTSQNPVNKSYVPMTRDTNRKKTTISQRNYLSNLSNNTFELDQVTKLRTRLVLLHVCV